LENRAIPNSVCGWYSEALTARQGARAKARHVIDSMVPKQCRTHAAAPHDGRNIISLRGFARRNGADVAAISRAVKVGNHHLRRCPLQFDDTALSPAETT
jgi:hypothetical protein